MLKREGRLGKSRHTREHNTKVDSKQGMDIRNSCRLEGEKKTMKAWICKGGEFPDPKCIWLSRMTVFHGVAFLVTCHDIEAFSCSRNISQHDIR
jgi:hypothetical protein